MECRLYILILSLMVLGCTQKDLSLDSSNLERSVAPAAANPGVSYEVLDDSVNIDETAVVFFTARAEELNQLTQDITARESLDQAVGDFAYYASIVADSLESVKIPVHFTNKRFISFHQGSKRFVIDRLQGNSPIGMIIFDGQGPPELIPGMQTHLSLLATISSNFQSFQKDFLPLKDHFEESDLKSLHVYSSHSEILNQQGDRIDPAHYEKLGASLASRANKYHMSVFAYQSFALPDSLYGLICRVPSRYDESAINLYIWDEQAQMVVEQIQLAENVWNENWIMVMDSWISIGPEQGTFSIVQRKKEASMKDGNRIVSDNLNQWYWTGSEFKDVATTGLSLNDFPLKDWESYQEPKTPTEISIVDENYVWLPLATGDLTWENLILDLPKPYTIEKEPIENQLAPDQIDTLITISRPHAKFKFYRSPEDNLILDGVLSDGSFSFKKGLKIGISKTEFVEAFDQLSEYDVVPDLVKVSSINRDRVFTYTFQNDTLARIDVLNYIH